MIVLASLIPPWAEHFLHHYGWIALILFVFLQDVGIPTGIPGTVLVLFGGYLVYSGDLNLHVAALSLALGAFIGASGMFLLAQYGGRPLVLRLGRYVGLTESRLNVAARGLERWGPPMLLITRIAPGTRVYMTLFAGISGWTYRRFALWTGFFVLLWSYTFVLLGAALGNGWIYLAHRFLRIGGILLGMMLLIGLVLLIRTLVQSMNRRGGAPLALAADALPPEIPQEDALSTFSRNIEQTITTTRTLPLPEETTRSVEEPKPPRPRSSNQNQTSSQRTKKERKRHAHSRPRR